VSSNRLSRIAPCVRIVRAEKAVTSLHVTHALAYLSQSTLGVYSHRMRSTEVRAERTERMEQARRTLQSNQKYSVDLVSPRAVRGLGPTTSCACGRSAAAAAGDLLRHQLWPLAFCRAGGRHDDVLHRLAARGSLQFWRRDLRGRHFIKSRCTGRLTTERRGDTHDVRLTHPFAVSGLLTYSRSAGRPAGCVIMTRRHGKLLLTSARTTT